MNIQTPAEHTAAMDKGSAKADTTQGAQLGRAGRQNLDAELDCADYTGLFDFRCPSQLDC